MNHMKIGAAGLAIAVTALIVPAAAQAESPMIVEAFLDRPVIYVSYADLNLGEKAGLDQLNRRVRNAATKLCIQPGVLGVGEWMRGHACRSDAIDGANRQIDVAVARFGQTQVAAASERKIAVALR